MKRFIILLFCCVIFQPGWAQKKKTSSKKTSTTQSKDQLNLRIRKNVTRPEGKHWYVNVGGGYGIPFLSTNKRSPLKEVGDKEWYQRENDLSVKSRFGTNGGGFCLNVGWGHMFNKYIGIDVLHTMGWHPEQLGAKIDLPTYYATQKTGTFGIYISPHLVMHWDNGKRFGITGKAGLVLPIFGKTESRAYILDNQGRVIETLGGLPILPLNTAALGLGNLANLQIEIIGKAHTSYHPTVGVSTSIGFDVKLNKLVDLFAEVRIQAYTIKLKETIFDEFSQTSTLNVAGIPIPAPDGLLAIPSQVKNAEEAPEFLKHYVYVDEVNEESNTARYGFKSLFADGLIKDLLQPGVPSIDIDKPMAEPGQKFNASSMYFNLGLRFNLTSKKRQDKLYEKQGKTNYKKGSKKPKMTEPEPEPGTIIEEQPAQDNTNQE